MAYATVEQLLARLAADGATTLPSSPVAQAKLDSVSADLDAYLHHDCEDHPGATVTAEGRGMDTLLLPGRPLRAISAVTVDGEALSAAEVAALVFTPAGKVVRPEDVWPDGAVCVFTCDWGYTEAPAKIVEATLRLASRGIRHGKVRERVAEGVKSESIEGYSITLDAIEMDRDVALLVKDLVWQRAAR